jgi:hypothetical protein
MTQMVSEAARGVGLVVLVLVPWFAGLFFGGGLLAYALGANPYIGALIAMAAWIIALSVVLQRAWNQHAPDKEDRL